VIGGFCEHSPVVHELVAKFADMTAKETAKELGWQLKEATAHQRHRIRQRLATGAWRDFHENKTVRLPYVDPSTEYARTLRHLTRGGEQRKTEHSRTPLGRRREWAAQQGGTCPLAASPAPAAQVAGERRGRPNASASLTERVAATHRKHGLYIRCTGA
jgi:hypothetical protein